MQFPLHCKTQRCLLKHFSYLRKCNEWCLTRALVSQLEYSYKGSTLARWKPRVTLERVVSGVREKRNIQERDGRRAKGDAKREKVVKWKHVTQLSFSTETHLHCCITNWRAAQQLSHPGVCMFHKTIRMTDIKIYMLCVCFVWIAET